MSFNNFSQFGVMQNGWPNQYTQPTQQWPTPQLKTNKTLVTSLEEAIAKSTERYSEMYYFDQNRPVFYIVRTDMNMVKSWVEIPYTVPNQNDTSPVTQADLMSLEARIAALETKAGTKKRKPETEQEVTNNVEST